MHRKFFAFFSRAPAAANRDATSRRLYGYIIGLQLCHDRMRRRAGADTNIQRFCQPSPVEEKEDRARIDDSENDPKYRRRIICAALLHHFFSSPSSHCFLSRRIIHVYNILFRICGCTLPSIIIIWERKRGSDRSAATPIYTRKRGKIWYGDFSRAIMYSSDVHKHILGSH